MKFQFKYIILIISILALLHCASESKNVKSYENTVEEKDADGVSDDYFIEEEAEELMEINDLEEDYDYLKEEFINQDKSLVSQKLQDFYDLLALQSNHPEFQDDVELQLKNYTKDSLGIYKSDDVVSINDIKLISQPIRLDENTIKIQIQFDVKSNLKKTTDSIYAYITKKETVIDGESFTSSKVIFSKD